MAKIRQKSASAAVRSVCLGAVASTILATSTLHAAPAAPGIRTLSTPDGSQITLKALGDEWFGWYETLQGKVVVKNPISKYFEYAEAVNVGGLWKLQPSGITLGASLNGFTPMQSSSAVNFWNLNRENAHDHEEYVYSVGATNGENESMVEGAATTTATTVLPTLIVMISFTDEVIDSTDASWNDLIFSTAPGKLNDYFNEATHGHFQVSPAAETYGTANDGIVRASLNYAHPNPGRNTQQDMLQAALNQIDPYVDFSIYDTNGNGHLEANELQVGFVVAGKESAIWGEDVGVWAHVTALSSTYAVTLDGVSVAKSGYGRYFRIGEEHYDGLDASIGIIGHEMGHSAMFLPDLYASGEITGISYWGMMGVGSWGKKAGEYSGETPSHYSAWSKINRGYVSQRQVNPSFPGQTYTLQSQDTGNYDVIRINTNNPDEYFLVENRQNAGYDQGIGRGITDFFTPSSGGLAIWHIDSTQYGRSGIKLERADGSTSGTSINHVFWQGNATDFDSMTTPSSDLNIGGISGVAISNVSASGSSMSFTLEEEVEPPFLCSSTSAAISAHVTAGRAYSVETVLYGWYKTYKYYAVGSDELLGSSSYTTVTLKESDEGFFETGECENWTIQVDTVEYVDPNGVRIVGSGAPGDNDLQGITYQIDHSGVWSAAGVGPNFWVVQVVNLSAGDHDITIRVTDVAGVYAEVTQTVTIENTVPVAPQIDSIAAAVSGLNVTVSGSASDQNDNLGYVEVEFDGSGNWVVATGAASWSHATTLTAGSHTVKARAVDTDGLVSAESDVVNFTLTNNAPTIDSYSHSVVAPAPNNPLYGLVTVTGVASDVDGDLQHVEIISQNGNGSLTCAIDSSTTANFTCEFTQEEGTFSYTLKATDSQGNEVETQAFDVTVTLPQGGSCFETTVADHTTAGRVYVQYSLYYVTGSNTYLGSTYINGNDVKALEETSPGYWEVVTSCP